MFLNMTFGANQSVQLRSISVGRCPKNLDREWGLDKFCMRFLDISRYLERLKSKEPKISPGRDVTRSVPFVLVFAQDSLHMMTRRYTLFELMATFLVPKDIYISKTNFNLPIQILSPILLCPKIQFQ